MDRVRLGPLSCSLIFEESEQEIFADRRVSVEKDGPGWHDHVNSVYILTRSTRIRITLLDERHDSDALRH